MYAQMANNIEDMTIEELRSAYKKLEKALADKESVIADKNQKIKELRYVWQLSHRCIIQHIRCQHSFGF